MYPDHSGQAQSYYNPPPSSAISTSPNQGGPVYMSDVNTSPAPFYPGPAHNPTRSAHNAFEDNAVELPANSHASPTSPAVELNANRDWR
jgi:hypothetical protein